MPDQPTDTNRNAIKVALGAALGSALGIITAVRTLSRGKRAAGSDEVGAPLVGALPDEEGERAPTLPERAPTRGAPTAQPSTGRPDWERLPPAHLPRPTYWPVVLAFAVALLAWGVVTTLAITVIGLALLALGLGGWIGELRHGHE